MNALVVLAREPLPGQVKSRLARDVSDERAAALYRAFILDTVRLCDRLPETERWLAFTPPTAGGAFASLVGSGWQTHPQAPGDLGDRLRELFRRLFDAGAERVVAVGSDSPTLPPALLRRAFATLAERDVVLGPCLDGGYYLIGLRSFDPRPFEDIPWGTANVFARSVEAVRSAGLGLGLLPPWYDVDTVADLRMMEAHLDGLRVAGEEIIAAETHALLTGLPALAPPSGPSSRLPGSTPSDLSSAV